MADTQSSARIPGLAIVLLYIEKPDTQIMMRRTTLIFFGKQEHVNGIPRLNVCRDDWVKSCALCGSGAGPLRLGR
jgi:hypothetical protein